MEVQYIFNLFEIRKSSRLLFLVAKVDVGHKGDKPTTFCEHRQSNVVMMG
jgi:Ribonuclease G/E